MDTRRTEAAGTADTIAGAVDAVTQRLAAVDTASARFLSPSDMEAAIRATDRLLARTHELRLGLLSSAGPLADSVGSRDTASWVAAATHVRRGDAAADVRLALTLAVDHQALACALRSGRINLDQARVIARSLDDLAGQAPADVIARAEEQLIAYAADFDPTDLSRLGRRILDVVAPAIAEAAEAQKLAVLERNARRTQRLTLRALGDGTTRISGLIPDMTAARLASYLHAFTNPRLHDTDGCSPEGASAGARPPQRPSHPRKLALAFGQLLEAIDPDALPVHGGRATTVVVTIELAALRKDLGVATFDNQLPGDGVDAMTAAEARRLACNAALVPVVLGGRSEVLDLGRSRRLFSAAQRAAMTLRDRTCRAQGCSVPATWCEAHHLDPWSRGGRTDIADGALLCAKHHHRIHDPDFAHGRQPGDGAIWFRRRLAAA